MLRTTWRRAAPVYNGDTCTRAILIALGGSIVAALSTVFRGAGLLSIAFA